MTADFASAAVPDSARRRAAIGTPSCLMPPVAICRVCMWLAVSTAGPAALPKVAWLDGLPEGQPWFLWLSFPDPHHPFDPPIDEVRARVDWRSLDLPAAHPGSSERIEEILAEKPRHWLDWYQGRFANPEGGPSGFRPSSLRHDQVREINGMIHVENELIDEAHARLLRWLDESGLDDNTDILYTSDHGELQGDYGLMFKGPYHVEALLRVPLIWRPARSSDMRTRSLDDPVGHVDIAPTLCKIAGLEIPETMDGAPLPTKPGAGRAHVLTTWDSQFAAVGMHLRTIYHDGFLCTAYEASSTHGGGQFPVLWKLWGGYRRIRDDLVALLRAQLRTGRVPPLRVSAST